MQRSSPRTPQRPPRRRSRLSSGAEHGVGLEGVSPPDRHSVNRPRCDTAAVAASAMCRAARCASSWGLSQMQTVSGKASTITTSRGRTRAQMARLTGRIIPTSSRITRRIATSSLTCIRVERRFLPWLAASADSVLDVGCGAGGFVEAWRACRPSDLLHGSRRVGPTCHGSPPAHTRSTSSSRRTAPTASRWPTGMPTSCRRWAGCTGRPRYADALAELWRLTGRYAFFDLRLVDGPGPDTSAVQQLALTADWDGRTTVPYICASWPRVAELLLGLGPARILAHGYWGRSAATVIGAASESASPRSSWNEASASGALKWCWTCRWTGRER